MKVTPIEIAELAVKLCQLSGLTDSAYSDEIFKTKFAFAYNLLVDAEWQLDKVTTRKIPVRKPNGR